MFDDDDDSPHAGPSFLERVQRAPPDDDDDLDLILGAQDQLIRPPPAQQNETLLQQLIRHWMNERHAPDILPIQEHLLSLLLDHIRKQVTDVLTNSCLLRRLYS
jgi:hypothetical protein